MAEPAATTGRLLVSFPPDRWGSISSNLRFRLGISTTSMAFTSDVLQDPSVIRAADVTVIPEVGIAVVSSMMVGLYHSALKQLPYASVRPEYRLANSPWDVVPAATSAPKRWKDAADIAWTLESLGLDASSKDGAGIRVGVIDSGVDRGHPDLGHCIEDTKSMLDGVDPDLDDLGHGTHVIGLIAGSADARPRYGIAPESKVISYRVYGHGSDAEFVDEGLVIAAVKDAIDRGCRIITLAAGRPGGDTFDAADSQLGMFVVSHGALLIAAAGNTSKRIQGIVEPTDAPANAPRLYAVGAVDSSSRLWDGSNGREIDPARRVDWVAPGVNVRSAIPGGGTFVATGTSVATAVAVGIATVVWSRNPSWSARDVAKVLSQTAAHDVDGPTNAIGDGRLQIDQ